MLVESNSIVDSLGAHLSHSIKCMQPIVHKVPHFDCENLGDSEDPDKGGEVKGYRYICVGLDIGSLVFMGLRDWKRIYCRLSVVNRHIGYFIEIGHYLVCCSGAGG
jgi:hypothetical protein